MEKQHGFFKPLSYRRYLPAMFGLWLVAFALGTWFGKDIAVLAWPMLILGLVLHGFSMRTAHQKSR